MLRRRLALIALTALAALLTAGCQDTIDQAVANLNARATAVAGGTLPAEISTAGAAIQATATALVPTQPPAGYFDISLDPAASLANAWGQVYALQSGASFEIIATEQQTGEFIIQQLQVSGWQETAHGGSATIDAGQIRVDLALVDADGDFGAGTVTFQPTLDSAARLRLNPQGASFGGLTVPDNFTAALGDSVFAALEGARNPSLARVTLSRLTLEDGRLSVAGTVK